MDPKELNAIFDNHASVYEEQQKKLAPIHDGLYFQLSWQLSGLPEDARIICVGVGAGAELSYLANKFPNWVFTAVEPSTEMLRVAMRRAGKEGFLSRCIFHQGYLASLPKYELYDAATSFLVSQFILDNEQRSRFFRSISERLKPNGILASADLSASVDSVDYQVLLNAWVSMLHIASVSPEAINKVHLAWEKSVAILPAEDIESIIKRGGFDLPVQFYQAGFVRAWLARKSYRGKSCQESGKLGK